MTAASRTDHRRIREEAADWALRLDDADFDPAERRAFETWLGRDGAHRDAFERARRTLTESMPAIAAIRAAAGAATFRGRAPRRIFATVAIFAMLILLVLRTSVMDILTADAHADVGETLSIQLPDGTIAQLNGDTALDIDYSAETRLVRLLRGEAYFDVAADPNRPFTVAIAGGRVTALGTAFDVNLLGDGAEITVMEHRVRVSTALDAGVIGAGSRATFDGTGALSPVAAAPAGLETPWRSGRLAFADRPLAQAAEELDRWLPGRLLVLGDALANRRVSGSFSLADPGLAAEAMASAFGLDIFRASPFLTVLY